MALLTPDQFLLAVDERRTRQLLSDSNTPVVGGLSDNEVLVELILQASGELLAACEVGKRYSEQDLQALVDSVPASAGGALVRRLVSDLTFALLVSRRGASAQEVDRQVPRYSIAQRQLEQLRQGVRIFPGVSEAAEAGLPVTTNNLTNPTNRPRLFTDSMHGRVFPFDPCRGSQYGDCC